jgi:signal transduction histidine kinase
LNYTNPGGSINLTAITTQLDTGPWVKICVKDTGVGIQEKELSHIFDRFYRGRASQLTNAPGTGLGLAISKEILERMGGRIEVESTPGIGSTFTVWVRAVL